MLVNRGEPVMPVQQLAILSVARFAEPGRRAVVDVYFDAELTSRATQSHSPLYSPISLR